MWDEKEECYEQEEEEAGNCTEKGEMMRKKVRRKGETTNRREGNMMRSHPLSRAS